MNNRTFTRAAGVSPPWFSEPHLQVQCAEFPRIELACKVHSTGGLRPPLLVGNASATGIVRIPAASSTGTSLRPGTRPPHMRIPSADSLRSPRGLTPPALGCATSVRCEKRHSRCKNARLQERRASARRGFPNRICKWNAMNFGVWIARAECIPRNAYAPPLVAACATYRVRYAFPIRNGGCVPRRAYAPRSWSGMRALGELCVFQLQIRSEHRYVRERAQHTCVFHLQTRYVHHGGHTPPAPGCTTFVRCKKRYSRCTIAHPAKHGMRQPAAIEASELLTVSPAFFHDGCRAFVQHGYGKLIMVEGEPRTVNGSIKNVSVVPGPPSK
jgi:hypothetical protein